MGTKKEEKKSAPVRRKTGKSAPAEAEVKMTESNAPVEPAVEKQPESGAPAKPAAEKKPGRKPMTPEEKAAAAKARAKEKAKAENLKPEFIVQYQGADLDLAALAESAKAEFRQIKKRTLITELKLYVKPEEHTAYYVINGEHTGSIGY